MATKHRLYGVDTIKIGACGSLGTMGSTLASVTKLKRDSVDLVKELAESFMLMIEESSAADFEAITDGKPLTLTFETYDVNGDNMVLAFGGTKSTSLKWVAPVLDVLTEKSVEIKTKAVEGFYTKLEIPRASVKASLVSPLKRTDAGTIRFVITTLTPEGTGGALLAPYTKTLVAV